MRRLNKKGQSTLEYILIWTMLVAALVAVTVTNADQPTSLRGKIEAALNRLGTKIASEVDDLSDGLNKVEEGVGG